MRKRHYFILLQNRTILWYSLLDKVGYTKWTSTFCLALWYADNDFIIICNNKKWNTQLCFPFLEKQKALHVNPVYVSSDIRNVTNSSYHVDSLESAPIWLWWIFHFTQKVLLTPKKTRETPGPKKRWFWWNSSFGGGLPEKAPGCPYKIIYHQAIVGISLPFGSYPRIASHPSTCSSSKYFASYLSAHFGLMTTSSVVSLCNPLPSLFFNFLIPGGYPVCSHGFTSDPGSVQQFTMNLLIPEITADAIFPQPPHHSTLDNSHSSPGPLPPQLFCRTAEWKKLFCYDWV